MNDKVIKFAAWFLSVIIFQGISYIYLDQVLLAPASAYKVSTVSERGADGVAYYSRDRSYKALVRKAIVEIYKGSDEKPIRTIRLGDSQVSFFRWLEDRDIALMGIRQIGQDGQTKVTLSQLHPLGAVHELSESISELPSGSQIEDVAYSTATNVIYMKVLIGTSRDEYRVYRTDANHDLQRIPLQTGKIGRIALLYEEDALVYDNLAEGTVIVRHGNGSWEIVSPPAGQFRLIGVDAFDTVHVARLNSSGLAAALYSGRVKGRIAEDKILSPAVDVKSLTLKKMGKHVR